MAQRSPSSVWFLWGGGTTIVNHRVQQRRVPARLTTPRTCLSVFPRWMPYAITIVADLVEGTPNQTQGMQETETRAKHGDARLCTCSSQRDSAPKSGASADADTCPATGMPGGCTSEVAMTASCSTTKASARHLREQVQHFCIHQVVNREAVVAETNKKTPSGVSYTCGRWQHTVWHTYSNFPGK